MYRTDGSTGGGLTREPLISPPASERTAAVGFKRVLDILGSLFFLFAFAWLFLAIAALIKVTMGGAVLFGHTRVGRNGRPFKCLKFRSMLPNSEQILSDFLDSSSDARREWSENFKLKNDPRVTRLGRFLRSSSLDELPQFWNVLKGEMSLVGPRPVTHAELVRYYGPATAQYVSMRPGLTGLWQVHGRSELSYRERVQFDTQYVRSWSLRADFSILWKTVAVVLLRRGAH